MEICLFIDSAEGKNLSVNGDSFSYFLSPPLSLPFDAKPVLRVLELDLWYTSPNVSAVKGNNTLRFAQITSGNFVFGTASLDHHEITFDDGLYSLQDIRDEIAAYCTAATIHDAALDIVGHNPTQKTIFKWDVQNTGYGVVLYLSDSTSIGSLLGFDKVDLHFDNFGIVTAKETANFKSGSSANFSELSHFLLHASCLSGSNYNSAGSDTSQVACAVTPDVAPGSLIRYRPLTSIPTQCDSLRGANTSQIVFKMTDNNGSPVVLKESWNARILISW